MSSNLTGPTILFVDQILRENSSVRWNWMHRSRGKRSMRPWTAAKLKAERL
ncbi:MAG TPA: hypothetical protein VGA56_25080 [Opitutaceae bacterium]